METLRRVVLGGLLSVLIGGCASHRSGPAFHAGDENPPLFFTGPAVVLLTNAAGFSAHVNAMVSAGPEQNHLMSGLMLGRGGHLIFQPDVHSKNKKARKEGGLFFIWDQPQHAGYVLSESLQGYAPIRSDVMITSDLIPTGDGPDEVIDGHPCHRMKMILSLNDGTSARLTYWAADDERHFPLRIDVVNGPRRLTLNLSDVRFEPPDPELFMPPDGFTPYASSVSLINELIVRETTLSKDAHAGEFDEPAAPAGNGWRPPTAQ